MSTTMTLPIEIYDILEHHFGHEDSRKVAQAIEASLTLIETRSIEVAQQKSWRSSRNCGRSWRARRISSC